jgi:4-amino-4-deoxy-L-arabinose transferase-like glycosyltransferase
VGSTGDAVREVAVSIAEVAAGPTEDDPESGHTDHVVPTAASAPTVAPSQRSERLFTGPAMFGPTLVQIRAKYDMGSLRRYDDGSRSTAGALLLLLAATAVAWWIALDATTLTSAVTGAHGVTDWVAWLTRPLDDASDTGVSTLSTWLIGGAVKIFGTSGWAVKTPEALMAAAAVGLVYGVVRRDFGMTAGLLAGAVFSVSSVFLLCLAIDHGDAAVTVLMAAAVFALLRGVDGSRAWWTFAALPLLIAVWVTRPSSAVQLVPAAALLTVAALGDSGLVRLLSTRMIKAAAIAIMVVCWAALHPSLGDAQPYDTAASGGDLTVSAVVTRLPVVPLIPAAVACGFLAALLCRHDESSPRTRAQVLAWAGWLVGGTTVALVCGRGEAMAVLPALAALIGIGAGVLWRHRDRPSAAFALSAATMVSAISSYLLLDAMAGDAVLLRWGVLLSAVAAAALLIAISLARPHSALCTWVGVLAAVTALAGPAGCWAHLSTDANGVAAAAYSILEPSLHSNTQSR